MIETNRDRAKSGLSVWTVIHRYEYPLRSLVWRDLHQRYGQTILGYGWTLLQPLVLLLLYTFVFSVLLQLKFHSDQGTGEFALYLMCGLIPFLSLSESIQQASTSLTADRGLVDKAIFPTEVLPVVPVVTATLNELIGLALLTGISVMFGMTLSWWILLLPVLVLFRVLLTLGLSWLVAVLNVFLTDLRQVLGLLLTAWMFLTPIVYPPTVIPDSFAWAVTFNPLYHLVEGYRDVILGGVSPLSHLPSLAIFAIPVTFGGLWFFRQTIDRAKDFV